MGGAFYIPSGYVMLSSTRISECQSFGDGAVFNLLGGSVLVEKNSLITNSVAHDADGGVAYIAGGQIYISGSTITGTTARFGGAIFALRGLVTVAEGSRIVNTSAMCAMPASKPPYHKAQRLAVEGGGELRLIVQGNSEIVNPSATIGGGAISVRSGFVRVEDSLIVGAATISRTRLFGGPSDDIQQLLSARGMIYMGGGCLDIYGGELQLVNATVRNSKSASDSGAILHMKGPGSGPTTATSKQQPRLLLATFTRFEQDVCNGSLFKVDGVGQVVLRDI
eukprot:1744230-Prymnesium_polylepis.1